MPSEKRVNATATSGIITTKKQKTTKSSSTSTSKSARMASGHTAVSAEAAATATAVVGSIQPFQTLPITLLSGFLGAGKTTLLNYILNSSKHGYRIAMIVNDMAAVNVDAGLVMADSKKGGRKDEKLIAMQNGCICCTLRGDFVIELAKMAKSGAYDYVIIESTGISEPQQVAESFTADFTEAMMGAGGALDGFDEDERNMFGEIAKAGGLNTVAKLDTTVTVLDAFRFFEEFETIEMLKQRFASEIETPEDERTVTDLMIDQIEFADVIIMNKIDMVNDDVLETIRGVIRTMNPGAKVIETSLKVSKQSENPYGIVPLDVKEILATGRYSDETAVKSLGWLKSVQQMSMRDNHGKMVMTPKPETLEYGINSFVYRARRPFSPERLFELVHDKFVILEPEEEEDDDDDDDDETENQEDDEAWESKSESESESETTSTTNKTPEFEGFSDAEAKSSSSSLSSTTDDTSPTSSTSKEIHDVPTSVRLANKKAHPIFKNLLRSKGFIWLATRPAVSGDWSQAGAMLTLTGGMNWFAVQPEEDWGVPNDEVKTLITNDFEGEFGDRRQEMVFIGHGLDVEGITELMDACLLDDGEMKAFKRIMRREKWSIGRKEEKLLQVFADGWAGWENPMLMEDEEGLDGHEHRPGGHRHHH